MCCGSPSTRTLRSGDMAAVDGCRRESGKEDGPKKYAGTKTMNQEEVEI